ncbi:DNA gyrase subunit A [Synechococcus sp. C9]|uniref:DNA gyrase subunit A n=1 Tax=Synechococcus sp. C9 TaxID=102119 RepID=UPI001FF55770|nr:DNA gyrase subunit A [Synechococcus sp. C9]
MSTLQERIIPTDLGNEMSRSYLEYAMSVIVGRALPDARDGLKPVHRRILYAMHDLGLQPNAPYKKCARVVGEVLGKYHPHGDQSVYDALVRMAQDFSMRETLIDGHGNFGSVDDDPPAAMRYTECRLRALSREALLMDIDAETVDFIPNFDGSEQEPTVLPARLPQLLLNGSAGIAVGMATNIPPHNLGELVDGLIALIQNPQISNAELQRHIPGPDFPTGGQILGNDGIREMYETGRGSITLRGIAQIETVSAPGRTEKEAIIVTQLPFQVNKAALIERIAELVNDKIIEGISDVRDESDRDGMRVVIELKRDALPQVVLNNLYKQTPLQVNFGANMLALVNREPELLTLRRCLEVFLEFREETIQRRTQYYLRKARERDEIVQGLLVALGNIDSIIALIRQAENTDVARQNLITVYELTVNQANAILDMQIRRLTALESEKVHQEHAELTAKIADLSDILARRERRLELIVQELQELKATFATPRRTAIIASSSGNLHDIDLIANEPCIILVTAQGYIKRMAVDTFSRQSRATRGKAGTTMKPDDVVALFCSAQTHDHILFFSDRGVVYALRAYQIPVASRTARGIPLVQLLPITLEEKITSILPVSAFREDEFIVMLTRGGFIKKTALSAFSNIRANGLIAISLEEGDHLGWVRLAKATDSILIGSRGGMAIRFAVDHKQLRPLGRATRGVRAMELRPGDVLVGMDMISPEDERDVLVVTMNGYGKRVPASEFRIQNRSGMGITSTKFRKQGDAVAGLGLIGADEEILLVTQRGVIIRQAARDISQQSRMATGVRLQRLDADDAIAAVAAVPPNLGDEEEEAS